jgi:hypothetical protein
MMEPEVPRRRGGAVAETPDTTGSHARASRQPHRKVRHHHPSTRAQPPNILAVSPYSYTYSKPLGRERAGLDRHLSIPNSGDTVYSY